MAALPQLPVSCLEQKALSQRVRRDPHSHFLRHILKKNLSLQGMLQVATCGMSRACLLASSSAEREVKRLGVSCSCVPNCPCNLNKPTVTSASSSLIYKIRIWTSWFFKDLQSELFGSPPQLVDADFVSMRESVEAPGTILRLCLLPC